MTKPLETYISVYKGAGKDPWFGDNYPSYAEAERRGEDTPYYVGTFLFRQVIPDNKNRGCVNCPDSDRCTNCVDCVGCRGCKTCTQCSLCTLCSNCDSCVDCKGCINCKGLTGKTNWRNNQPLEL